jgi:glutathione S-transferase
LTPEDPAIAKEAEDLEKRFDYGFGIHLRRICYHAMLKEPRQLRKLITAYGPWYGKNIYRLILPVIKSRLTKEMKLNAMETERSRSAVNSLLQILDKTVENRDYLVGEQFSRADLSAAALLSPVILPEEHPYYHAAIKLPNELMEFRQSLEDRPSYQWVKNIYQKHRWEVKQPEHYIL